MRPEFTNTRFYALLAAPIMLSVGYLIKAIADLITAVH